MCGDSVLSKDYLKILQSSTDTCYVFMRGARNISFLCNLKEKDDKVTLEVAYGILNFNSEHPFN